MRLDRDIVCGGIREKDECLTVLCLMAQISKCFETASQASRAAPHGGGARAGFRLQLVLSLSDRLVKLPTQFTPCSSRLEQKHFLVQLSCLTNLKIIKQSVSAQHEARPARQLRSKILGNFTCTWRNHTHVSGRSRVAHLIYAFRELHSHWAYRSAWVSDKLSPAICVYKYMCNIR